MNVPIGHVWSCSPHSQVRGPQLASPWQQCLGQDIAGVVERYGKGRGGQISSIESSFGDLG